MTEALWMLVPETLVGWLFFASFVCFMGVVVMLFIATWNLPLPETDEEWAKLEEARRRDQELAFWICIMSA